MNNILKVFIGTGDTDITYQSLDLYADESVSFINSVQNVKDISKLFSDFTHTFSVPASAHNNAIFQHYYNPLIVNGYDAQIRKNSRLELNNAPFKNGVIRLDKVIMKNGKPSSYKITFFGEITKLIDKFGKDTLNDLDLTAYTHKYDFETVKSLMTGSNDVAYPLISTRRNWEWNTRDQGDTTIAANDIKYHPVTFFHRDATGIQHTELRPALRLIKIIEAIESKYGITFSNDFFTSGSHFNDIFMWANRNIEDAGVKINGEGEFTDWQPMEIGGKKDFQVLAGWPNKRWKDENTKPNPENKQVRLMQYELTITPLTGFETVPYEVKVADGYQSDTVTGTQTFTEEQFANMSLAVPNNYRWAAKGSSHTITNILDFSFRTDREFQFTATLVQKEKWRRYKIIGYDTTFPADTTWNTINVTESGLLYFSDNSSNQASTKGALPVMTIKDFLSGLLKMFNLVIIANSETDFTVQTLDDWYSDGSLVDISKYIDTSTHTVARPSLNKSIKFEYEKTKAVTGKKFFELNERSYGDLDAPNIEFDGPDFSIKLPFENLLHERLTDRATGTLTTIHVGKAISVDDKGQSKSVETKPVLFYVLPDYPQWVSGSGGAISLTNAGQTVPLLTYNMVSQCNSYNNADITQTLNFGTEVNSFTLIQPPNGQNGLNYSLYSNYWRDYISDLYDERRRLFSFDGKLPINILTSLKLNDKLVIDDTRYTINELNINLKSGDVKLQLLNEIYTNELDTELNAKIGATAKVITCANQRVTLNGSESTGLGLSYDWGASAGGVIIGPTGSQTIDTETAGDYTLTITDSFAQTDNSTFTVTDSRITPNLSIISSSNELTYNAQTVTLASSLASGYGYTWSTENGNITSGSGTNTIIVDSEGVYYLDVIQNNTGCTASDNVTITTGDIELPTVPAGLHTTNLTTSSFTLNWEPSTDDFAIQNYDVYKDNIYYTTTATTSSAISGLNNGQSYKMEVLARDTSDNVSEKSAPLYQITGDLFGGDGADAKAVKLQAASYIITYDENGLNPNPATVICTAVSQNVGTPWFKFIGNEVPVEPTFTIGSGNTDTTTFTSPTNYFNDAKEVQVQVSDGDQISVASDTISIAGVKPGISGSNGLDAYTIVLSNEAHTLSTTNEGVVTYTGSGTDIIVYKGISQLTGVTGSASTGTYSVTPTPTNITVGTITGGTPLTVGDHSNMTQVSADISFSIDLEGLFTVTKKQTLSKSIEGAAGSSGTNAKVASLVASSYVITYDQAGVEEPAGQSITLTATSSNHVGTVYYDFLDEAVSKQNSTSNTYVIPDVDEPIGGGVSTYTVNTREGSSGGIIIATDSLSIVGIQASSSGSDGADGIDGNGIQFIYYLTSSFSTPSTPIGVGNPVGWTDDPIDVSITNQYEYISQRTYTDAGGWTLYSTPTLWAKWSADGADGADGTDGTDGAPGPSGSDGQTTYVHYAYATSADGSTGFSTTYTGVEEYVGTLTDFVLADSTNYLDYEWSLFKGADGLDGLTFVLTNEAHTFPADSDGLVSSYANSGTEIYVYEGTQILPYVPGTTSAGQWKVVATPVNIVVGTLTDSGNYLTVGNHSSMTADNASISYAITGKRLDGTGFAFTKTQSFSKSKAGEPGVDGQGVMYIFKNQVSETPPATPTIATYIAQGWTDDPTGVTVGIPNEFVSLRTSDSAGVWSLFSTPVLWANYAESIAGLKTTSGYIYYQTAQASAPATPSATSYTFSTYSFTGLTSGWSKTPPVATGGGKYWVSVYNVTETTALGDSGSPSFTTPSNSLQFTDIVTFTNLSTVDDSSTVIDGSNITTGIIKSQNYTTGTAPFSANGTSIDLVSGSITSETFAIQADGDAFFKGKITGGTMNINDKFFVSSTGILTAVDGFFSGSINSSTGVIAGWELSNDIFGNDNIKLNALRPAIEIYSGSIIGVDINSNDTLTDLSGATITASPATMVALDTDTELDSDGAGGSLSVTQTPTILVNADSGHPTFTCSAANAGKTAVLTVEIYYPNNTTLNACYSTMTRPANFIRPEVDTGIRLSGSNYTSDTLRGYSEIFSEATDIINNASIGPGTTGQVITKTFTLIEGEYKISPVVANGNVIASKLASDSWTLDSDFNTPYLRNINIDVVESITEIVYGGLQVQGSSTAFMRIDRLTTPSLSNPFVECRGFFSTDTHVPAADDTYDLGSASPALHWNDLFIQNSPTVGSDRNSKNSISGSDLGLEFINDLKPSMYKLNNGTSNRIHYGLIAQDVSESLSTFDKDTQDFAGVCSDTIGSGSEAEIAMSLRYSEFISPMIKAIQELSTKVKALETQISGSL